MIQELSCCERCIEELGKVLLSLHALNNKLTAVSGGFDYVKDDPGFDKTDKEMLLLAIRACREYAGVAMESGTVIEKTIHEIKRRLSDRQKENPPQ